MRLVLASNNAKKLAELQALFAALPIDLVTQGSLGIDEAEEPHITFVENALAKARHAARRARSAAIADDSGLCVDAIGGAPGVRSARYATLAIAGGAREDMRAMQDAANNRLLLERMDGVADRRARFVSALVAVRSAEDPEPLVALGRWHGTLLEAPRGTGGFGYDPLMFIAPLDRTVAELDAEVKNRHSHRAIASQQMLALMREVWHLG
ncbi:RdgB/HAM1 family non-canonical purine NTP pyrophosphatase [Piscinibacter sp. XHJ-5]|uniref:RdgB/HAM1 family non-canonical purine NTP pyrophosphatase n=1 Tax=Piscinibacter sp. XHJ-5 TaxID=3037797 RepID=UPI0024534CF6|nr:RdgB/HAM1 family non-canonical purine NTP pyrophosphatase [Piscinibacter sp. XHJ-5]